MLHANLKRADALGWFSSPVHRELEALYHQTAAINMRFDADLRALGARLVEADTPVVVLKGMALLDSLYDDPGMRATGDIDLWVAGHRRAALHEVLDAAGFRPEPFYPDTYRRGATTIDVHTHVLTTARIRARGDILALGEASLLERRRPTSYGAAVTRLSVASEILLLSLHLMKHNADRLLWIIEINEHVGALDEAEWSELLASSDAMGQRGSLRRVAILAELLLPHTAVARLRHAAVAGQRGLERRVLQRRVTKGTLPVWGPLVFFSATGWGARVRSIIETLFPRPAVLRQVFRDADASAWRLYARRFGQLVALVLRSAAR